MPIFIKNKISNIIDQLPISGKIVMSFYEFRLHYPSEFGSKNMKSVLSFVKKGQNKIPRRGEIERKNRKEGRKAGNRIERIRFDLPKATISPNEGGRKPDFYAMDRRTDRPRSVLQPTENLLGRVGRKKRILGSNGCPIR